MQRRTVFLLQDTKENNEELSRLIDLDKDYEVVGSATDGISGISGIQDKKPDFVILELVLPGYDGISVMEKIKSQGLNSKFIVLSALCREEIISRAIDTGAKYFMAKPFNFQILKERMDEIAEEKDKPNKIDLGMNRRGGNSLEEKISKIFINVGIPPHIKGYSFLREGVKMAVEDPEIINNITKKLYPMIGEKFSTTASKVERAIRHAIEVAWNRGRIDSINGILGVRAYVGSEKPTNGEFIALVADKMLLERA
jgi:two-component system response regulator (stage 0 sporulation protein A)